MKHIPIGRKGFIRNEGVLEPYILIQDDRENTGGYYVYKYASSDMVNGFDDWVLEGELEDYFRDSGWQVDWLEKVQADVEEVKEQ